MKKTMTPHKAMNKGIKSFTAKPVKITSSLPKSKGGNKGGKC